MLLKYEPLVVFLRENSQETYVEIQNIYSEIMSKLYFNLIKIYVGDSSKLIEERITKADLIIVDEQFHQATIQKFQHLAPFLDSQSSSSMSSGHIEAPISPFSYDDREVILEKVDSHPIVAHAQKNKKYMFEAVFRSQNKILMETISKEFIFVMEFFALKPNQTSYLFNQIFQKTVNFYLDWLKNYVNNVLFDPYASLLCLLVTE